MKSITLLVDGKEIETQVNEEDLKALENEETLNEELWKRDYRLCLQRYLVRYMDEDSARALSLWYEVKQFADKNDKREDNFTKESEIKYYIYFNYGRNTPAIDWRLTCKEEAFQIYFNSKETAQKAIDEFHDELIWYFTEYGKDNKTTTSKEIQYEVNVGSGCANGTVFVDEGATDEEIRLAIMDDLYDVDYCEIVK